MLDRERISEELKANLGYVSDAGRWGSLVSFGLRVAVTAVRICAGPFLPHFATTSDSDECLLRGSDPQIRAGKSQPAQRSEQECLPEFDICAGPFLPANSNRRAKRVAFVSGQSVRSPSAESGFRTEWQDIAKANIGGNVTADPD